jgi:uncharacterized protein
MNWDKIRNEQGELLDAAFHPGERSEVLLILGHGVTGDKDRPLLVALAEGLSERGWPCLRVSYSGNGQSEGRFVASCITKEVGDLRSVLSAVPEGVKVAYAGHSMGGAVGVLTAAVDERICVLVSLAGMTHTADFVRREFSDVVPDEGCMWDEEDCPLSQGFVDDLSGIGNTLCAAAKVTQPWLLIHGGEDDVVPVTDGRDAFDAATSVKELLEIPRAGHSFGEDCYTLIIDAMDRWLSERLARA